MKNNEIIDGEPLQFSLSPNLRGVVAAGVEFGKPTGTTTWEWTPHKTSDWGDACTDDTD